MKKKKNIEVVGILAQESSQSNHVFLEPPFLCAESLLAKKDRWLWGQDLTLLGRGFWSFPSLAKLCLGGNKTIYCL